MAGYCPEICFFIFFAGTNAAGCPDIFFNAPGFIASYMARDFPTSHDKFQFIVIINMARIIKPPMKKGVREWFVIWGFPNKIDLTSLVYFCLFSKRVTKNMNFSTEFVSNQTDECNLTRRAYSVGLKHLR